MYKQGSLDSTLFIYLTTSSPGPYDSPEENELGTRLYRLVYVIYAGGKKRYVK